MISEADHTATFRINFGEYHDEFPELVTEDGKGWLYSHVRGIIAYIDKHGKEVSKGSISKGYELQREFRKGWYKKLKQLQIDLDYEDEDGITNRERMARGLAPLDSKTGKPIELHHLGQKANSPLVELTEEEHRTGEYEEGKKNQSLWHDNTIDTEVHGEGNTWDQERKAYWKERAKGVKSLICKKHK